MSITNQQNSTHSNITAKFSQRQIAVSKLPLKHALSAIATFDHNLATLLNAAISSTPEEEYHCYQASYQFGSTIIKDGVYHLPVVNGKSIAFDDPRIPNDLRQNLATSADPRARVLAMILNKSSEVYLKYTDGLTTHAIIKPGHLFGVTPTDSSPLTLNLNAGARSVFMLQKMSDSNAHTHLQRALNLKTPTPKSYAEHYKLFVEIAKAINCPWRCELIFFSYNLIDKLQQALKTAAFANLACYLLEKQQLLVQHLQLEQACNLSLDQIEPNLANYNSHPLLIAKKTIKISLGTDAGFRFAIDDEMLPKSFINQAYAEHYHKHLQKNLTNLTNNNIAIIMEPSLLDDAPVYYPLNYPLFNQLDKSAKLINKLGTLVDTSMIINCIRKLIEQQSSMQFINQLLLGKQFAFYHSSYHIGNCHHQYNNIRMPDALLTTDSRMQQLLTPQQAHLLCNSFFFKGCIQIASNAANATL